MADMMSLMFRRSLTPLPCYTLAEVDISAVSTASNVSIYVR
jgi:hypothetical protein